MPFAPASVCTDGGQRQLTSPVGWRSLESCVPALTPALRTAHSLLVIRHQGSSSEQGSNFTLHPSPFTLPSCSTPPFINVYARPRAKAYKPIKTVTRGKKASAAQTDVSARCPVSVPRGSNFTRRSSPSLLFFSLTSNTYIARRGQKGTSPSKLLHAGRRPVPFQGSFPAVSSVSVLSKSIEQHVLPLILIIGRRGQKERVPEKM